SFDPGDRPKGAPVAIVSANLARQLWQRGQPAIGSSITVREWGITAQVVGVVADIRFDGYGHSAPTIYLPIAQQPLPQVQIGLRGASARGLRGELATADPNLLVWQGVQSLDDQLSSRLNGPRTEAVNVSTYAILAVLVCLAGVIALTLLIAGLRRRSVAIRASLGGRPLQVVVHGMSRLSLACGIGAAAGAWVAAVFVGRALPEAGAITVTGIGCIAAIALWVAVAGLAIALAYADAKRANLAALLKA
ncbi:MAG: ABC transporter permease, partial [Terracidiphilus sp.]